MKETLHSSEFKLFKSVTEEFNYKLLKASLKMKSSSEWGPVSEKPKSPRMFLRQCMIIVVDCLTEALLTF